MALSAGTRLGSYEILEPLGAGGMGEVYRARHVKLGRDVAIKVLPTDLAGDGERRKRFEREARTASSLDHPNIVTIYDIAEHGPTTYIAMELVEGATLRQLSGKGPLPIDQVLELAGQIAEGLSRAHGAGVAHRDLKPDNVMVTSDGRVKILDFGLAKPVAATMEGDSELPTQTKTTRAGALVGTPGYMSPEQLSNGVVDHRSDQFAFGIVLYEILGGRRPFEGASLASIIGTVLHDSPLPLRRLRRDVPRDLEEIVLRCLEKDPGRRYPSSTELRDAMRRCQGRHARSRRLAHLLRQPPIAAGLVLVALAVATAAVLWLRGADRRWAKRETLLAIAALVETGDLYEAYRLGLAAREHLADDPELATLLGRFTIPLLVRTDPSGAEVYVKGYETPEASWERLGTTPLQVLVPYALMRWQIVREGFEPFEGAPYSSQSIGALVEGLVLDPVGSRPPEMVRVAGGVFSGGAVRLPIPRGPGAPVLAPYWLDRFEVTNREYHEFVVAGGYRHPDLWSDLFPNESGELSWEEAMESFRDSTGRPGPATWELGTFPEGTAEMPVGGVSWYEAAAYCRSRGKSLPTIYHWFHAIGQEQRSEILGQSNFGTSGPAPVGRYQGISGYGAYDMAGNVKEWSSNATSGGRRYVLGGAWNDTSYMFRHLVARQPLERLPTYGMRCARYGAQPDASLLEPLDPLPPTAVPRPVSDEVFEAYASMYDFAATDLEARIEAFDDSSPYWRKETASYTDGDERMRAFLFLPRNAAPPYQTVLWFPGGDAFIPRSSDTLASAFLFDFIPRSGRALVYPVFLGSYERFIPQSREPIARRDMTIHWSRELARTLDYLGSRDDIDTDKLAYYGFSSGAILGPIFTAVHPRFHASILLGAGLIPLEERPEANPVHFAPRSRVPTLMVSGRDDFILPYESSQKPFFDVLGAPETDKRLVRLEGGHIPPDRKAIIREVLDWLDRYLGPVEGTTAD